MRLLHIQNQSVPQNIPSNIKWKCAGARFFLKCYALTNLSSQQVVPVGSTVEATANGSRESTGAERINVQVSSSTGGPATGVGSSCIGLSDLSTPPAPSTSPRTSPSFDVTETDATLSNNTKNRWKVVLLLRDTIASFYLRTNGNEDIPRMTHSPKGDDAHPRHNVADES